MYAPDTLLARISLYFGRGFLRDKSKNGAFAFVSATLYRSFSLITLVGPAKRFHEPRFGAQTPAILQVCLCNPVLSSECATLYLLTSQVYLKKVGGLQGMVGNSASHTLTTLIFFKLAIVLILSNFGIPLAEISKAAIPIRIMKLFPCCCVPDTKAFHVSSVSSVEHMSNVSTHQPCSIGTSRRLRLRCLKVVLQVPQLTNKHFALKSRCMGMRTVPKAAPLSARFGAISTRAN